MNSAAWRSGAERGAQGGARLSQVVTVTLNPAIDQTVQLDTLTPGAVHRARDQHLEAGGKGIGVASVLAALGVPVAASGWLGADNAGIFEAAFARRGIADQMLRIAGSTRTNIKLAETACGTTTDIDLPGLALDEPDRGAAEAALAARLAALLAPGDWCELAGSLPPGAGAETWLRLAHQVHASGARLVLDVGGAALAALLRALREPLAGGAGAMPALIKPNRAELEQFAGCAFAGRAEVADAASALHAAGVSRVIASLGAEGAVIVGDGGRWWVSPPALPVATTAGAGDALLAGTLAALIEGQVFPGAALFGMACAAARIRQIALLLPARAEIDALAAGLDARPL